jgi:hypothetical protein
MQTYEHGDNCSDSFKESVAESNRAVALAVYATIVHAENNTKSAHWGPTFAKNVVYQRPCNDHT